MNALDLPASGDRSLTLGNTREAGSIASIGVPDGHRDDFSDFINYSPEPISPTALSCQTTASFPLSASGRQPSVPPSVFQQATAALSMSDCSDAVLPPVTSVKGRRSTVLIVPSNVTSRGLMPKTSSCSTSGAAGSSKTHIVRKRGRQFDERAAKAAIRHQKTSEEVLKYVTGAREAIKKASEQDPPYSAPYAQYCANLGLKVEERMMKLVQTYHTLCMHPALGKEIENSKRKKQTFTRGLTRLVASLDPYEADTPRRFFSMARLANLEDQQKEFAL